MAVAQNVAEIIRTYGVSKADEVMIIEGDRSVTWGETYGRSGQVAAALTESGVGAHDRVAYIDKNAIEYFELLFGSTLLDAVLVAVNWRLAAPEMLYIVNDSEAKVLVVHEDFAEQLAVMVERGFEHNPKIIVIGAGGDHQTYTDWLDGKPTTDPGGTPDGQAIALQLYTSGTTGLPKGAQLTNDNFHALLVGAQSWTMDNGSVNMAAMPLFHIGGSGWSLFGMSNGARTVLIRELNPMTLLGIIEEHKISHAFLVPAALQFLLMVPSDDIDLSSMELMAYGASPITEDILVKSMAQFSSAGYIQVYGLTETAGAVTQLFPEDHDPGGPKQHLLRSAGRPLPNTAIKIVDGDTGNELPDGEVGEVWIQTPQNMLGYWKLPEATAEALPGDNWFRSGDAGYMKEGFLYIHDRVKDMIISGGENIYPAEIENVLMGIDGVADCAVIGVPDEKWGETPKAIVIKSPDTEISPEEIIAQCRGELAGFKCPTSVDFVEAIPRNPSGKILKRELREPYWEGRDRNV